MPEIRCSRCDSESENLVPVQRNNGDGTWCQACVDAHSFECSDCNFLYAVSISIRLNSEGDRICFDCSKNYNLCSDCERIVSNDDLDEDYRCGSCLRQTERQIIQAYDARADGQFYGTGPNYLGVELEVEVTSGSAPEAHALKVLDSLGDFAITKEDGSIHNGFEICTAPASLDEQKKRWPSFFADATSGLKSFQTTTCGLHVHASRRPLSTLQIGRVVCFVNSEFNRKFVETIAQRPSGQRARIWDKKLADGHKTNDSKYEAVNLRKRGTIEFRIFKGTLRPSSFFKSLEFVSALIQFTAPASRSLNESLDHQAFIDYVKSERKTFPFLNSFVAEKCSSTSSVLTSNKGEE